MSRFANFEVEVKFSDKIVTDKDHDEIAGNIAKAIVFYVDGMGIAPEECDAFTVSVSVRSVLTGNKKKVSVFM